MKADLITSIGVAIFGVVASYIVCNLFFGPIESVSFTAIESEVNTNLEEPNVEVFNYKALNPTVEVYVGNCDQTNGSGGCTNNTSDDTNAPEENQDLNGS